MELITILNSCHRFRGFVYQHAHFSADKKSIEVAVRPRKGSAAVCSRCHLPAPGYDQLAERRFEFILLSGFLVFLLYTMRRVDCRRCGVVAVEEVPWGDGKRTLTKAYRLFLARWARRLSWKETAEAFRTPWDKVFDAVEHVVTWGLEHRTLGQIDAMGVDEIQYSKGHKYLTLVYQIDLGVTRLLWVGKERTIESFQGFFTTIGEEITSKIVFICSDMWEPYLKVIREKCSEALHILDRFHIVAKMNKALDEVLAEGDRLRLDMHMEVGQVVDSIEVRAQTPALQADTSSLGTLINEKAVQDLPLNGRNFIRLAQLSAGANEDADNSLQSGNRPDDRRNSTAVAVNGQHGYNNNFMIDGLDDNERYMGTIVVKPAMDALAEFKLITNGYAAELGRTAGGVINLITKSGSSQFHGSLFEFFRNEKMDAKNFFAGPGATPAFKQNQFGGSLAGPIKKRNTFI